MIYWHSFVVRAVFYDRDHITLLALWGTTTHVLIKHERRREWDIISESPEIIVWVFWGSCWGIANVFLLNIHTFFISDGSSHLSSALVRHTSVGKI